MASTKSAETMDREVSQKRARRFTVAELTQLLHVADEENAALRAECSRKEQWINRYAQQLKAARSKVQAPAVNTFAEKSASRREAAIALGQELGRGATGAEVDAYLAR